LIQAECVDRTVSPELLDSLPFESAAARHSRRDIRWFNRLLGNDRWWRRALPALGVSGPGIEVGAGEGTLASEFNLHGLDLKPAPDDWPLDQAWYQADVVDFDQWEAYPLIVSNLFLHQLSDTALAQLGRRWNTTAHTIIVSETWRAKRFRTGFALLCWLIRAHEVSRYDGRVSVEGGFRGNELPQLLGLDPALWQWQITHSILGMYRMVARKREALK
jgi:hypothetical protein